MDECTLKGIITAEINLIGTIKQQESFYTLATEQDILNLFKKENNNEEFNRNGEDNHN